VLRRIFGRKRDEVTGEWRKLYNEELNDLYCSTTRRAGPLAMKSSGCPPVAWLIAEKFN